MPAGVDIWSLDYYDNEGFNIMSGTSQAAPCVTGIVALMLSKNPELTPAQICRILEETCLRLTPNKSNITGFGRVDALAAVNAVPAWDAVDETFDPVPDVHDPYVQRIFDLKGRLVTPDRLSPGVYLIQYQEGDQLKTKKVILP